MPWPSIDRILFLWRSVRQLFAMQCKKLTSWTALKQPCTQSKQGEYPTESTNHLLANGNDNRWSTHRSCTQWIQRIGFIFIFFYFHRLQQMSHVCKNVDVMNVSIWRCEKVEMRAEWCLWTKWTGQSSGLENLFVPHRGTHSNWPLPTRFLWNSSKKRCGVAKHETRNTDGFLKKPKFYALMA